MQLLTKKAKKCQRNRRYWGPAEEEKKVVELAAPAAPAEAQASARADDTDNKFLIKTLVLGASEVAAGGLDTASGLTDDVKGGYLVDPLAAIELEVLLHGSKQDCDNFYYIWYVRASLGARERVCACMIVCVCVWVWVWVYVYVYVLWQGLCDSV